jgi:CheY-specific phosphatase CheX
MMVNSVTTTMMDVKFALSGQSGQRVAYRRAVLPIPGMIPVSVVLACDQASCKLLGAKLFCVTPEEVDVAMIEDTLRELANITAGQVKRAMSLDQALGLPRILEGSESWSSAIEGTQLVHLRAVVGDIQLELQIATHPRGS